MKRYNPSPRVSPFFRYPIPPYSFFLFCFRYCFYRLFAPCQRFVYPHTHTHSHAGYILAGSCEWPIDLFSSSSSSSCIFVYVFAFSSSPNKNTLRILQSAAQLPTARNFVNRAHRKLDRMIIWGYPHTPHSERASERNASVCQYVFNVLLRGE